ncbi:MFS transporter [Microbispora triticiradicis]|uniref:MFS transporter n=2 Tax=Microbispora TaxID=2005 RepID=A0ABY3LP96_9ACTN|nr:MULTISPECIES: MFS transporter [Microbispora]TLP57889.1 MFS transporter [Microbispora fusca]TYB44388.1 MFS transporter [Microbispora tritici]GLW25284.1 MFS transporter [Microbispora amethystogenes]
MAATEPGRLSGRHRRPPATRVTYREVAAIPEFRSLWLGQGMSLLGDQLAQVALAVLVYSRTASPLATASVYALTYLPPILGGPLLAGLADRYPRRRVMLWCDLLRALTMAAMAVPATPFPVLCALVFCVVLLGAPFSAARAALLPEVLEGDRYVVGSALQNMTNQAVQMLGFAAGGAAIAVLGPYRALALDCATFLGSALVIFAGVRRRPAPEREDGERPSVWRMTRAGARLVFRERRLRTLVLFALLCGFYVLPEGIAAPYAATLADGRLPVAVITGLLMAAMPTGTVLGAFVFGRFVTPVGRLRGMGWLAMLTCAPLVVCVVRPPLEGVLALWVLSGVGGAYQLAANAAFVQCVPPSGRAAAFGLVQSGLMAAQGTGILIGGAAAQRLGPEPVVTLAGIAGLCAAAVLAVLWTESRTEIIAKVRAAA